jgi:succinate-semialdehyde dehydrogenase/glutarate-semialdehyde dehydrogenase
MPVAPDYPEKRKPLCMIFESINPYTEKKIAEFQPLNQKEIEAKRVRSRNAFSGWKKLSLSYRLSLLENLAVEIEKDTEFLSAAMVEEMGKTMSEARAEVLKCAAGIRFFIEKSPEWLQARSVFSDARSSKIHFQPLGGILLVMPWNFPLWQVLRAAVPALCVGNVILLKHAPNVFRYSVLIEDLFRRAGFPGGVFENFMIPVEGLEELVSSDAVAAVSLTGSERAGRSMAALAGKHLKKCVLELGGSDPFMVMPDADIPFAAGMAAKARLINNGQSCIAAKRFLVHQSVEAGFLEMFREEISKFKPGNPLDNQTLLGPQARHDLCRNLEEQLALSVRQGALVYYKMEEKTDSGFFFQPHILRGAKPGMACFDEEIFGPIAAVTSFSDEEEMLRLANQTRFGLGASIYTADVEKAEKLALELDCGTVTINAMVRSKPGLPFGGVKASGYGRELSDFGLQEFCNIKAVSVG